MGLLTDLGQILTPEETAKLQPFLKMLGIKQFLFILKKYKNWQKTIKPSIIKWGQEIQGHFLIMNKNKQLELCFQPLSEEYQDVNFPLVLQYGRWMFQMTPSQPYESQCNFVEIINKIKKKYDYLHNKSRIALTIPNIPFLGLRSQQKQKQFDNTITKSDYIDDKHIANHLRFRTLTKNIRIRRGCKVQINVPIFIDKNTDKIQLSKTEPNPNFIHMDAMAFGMGMSCLQCTFSTKNLDHARYVYDQMNVLSPLLLAVTAGTPFYKGKIADWDVRWKTLQASVDCRNSEQRNSQSPNYIPTSRYCPAQLYIWSGQFNKPQYNDIHLNINPQIKQFIAQQAKQKQIQIDEKLLEHIANIFKRDVLIAHQKFKQMNEQSYTIFEMLNGTNWNSVRLKIPIDDSIGWRVQFRTMEVQLTAEQNAAFSLLIHFFTRVLHSDKKINLYIPMSKVMQNFDRAHKIDAVLKQKFYFRTNIFQSGQPVIQQLTLHEIFFGTNKNNHVDIKHHLEMNNIHQIPNHKQKTKQFIGIFSYIKETLLSQCQFNKCKTKCPTFTTVVSQVFDFISEITSGKRLTLARWMRNFVDKHPKYTHNSILPKQTMDDLLLTLNQICKGTIKDQNFYPIFDK